MAEGIAQLRQGLAAWRAMGAEVAVPWWLALLAETCGKASQLDEGLRVLEEALTAVQHNEEHNYEAEVYRLKGELIEAQTHSRQGLACYDPAQHRTSAVNYGQDPGVVCGLLGATTLWMLGYPDQALQGMEETLALARRLAHPFSLAQALLFSAEVLVKRALRDMGHGHDVGDCCCGVTFFRHTPGQRPDEVAPNRGVTAGDGGHGY